MFALTQRLQVREEEVAAKVMDGEAIIINLATGNYYSMDKTGGLIWEMIQAGHTLDETLSAITARYDVSQEQAQTHLEQLVRELLQENLISPSQNGGPATVEPLPDLREKLKYELPKLNIYRDMGDLLALDPPTPGLSVAAWKNPGDKSSD
jgi:hypothetical protein